MSAFCTSRFECCPCVLGSSAHDEHQCEHALVWDDADVAT